MRSVIKAAANNLRTYNHRHHVAGYVCQVLGGTAEGFGASGIAYFLAFFGSVYLTIVVIIDKE